MLSFVTHQMDFDNENEPTWNWQDIDLCLSEGPQYEISPWTEDTTKDEDVSNMINDTTPVKACVDVPWKVSESDDLIKEYEESRQAKRRRMLQFTDEPVELPLCTEELSSAYLKTKAMEESVESLLPEISLSDGTSSDFASVSNLEMMEPDEWLTELLNDTDMNSEDVTLSAASDVHFSISDFCEIQTNHEAQSFAQRVPKPAPKTLSGKVIFKGRKSYIKSPNKPASLVAYPFTFIKPCPEKGGMTLQDINQKIHSPPKKPDPLPKSAFSGKLVVGKTRIRTEGGKGSITIMRTRG